ncbi:MAG: protein of unknown function with transrane region [Parcubacteria group bacterium]|nr:protein of unknown function with transrane region [Parcubacteria group bacterium]
MPPKKEEKKEGLELFEQIILFLIILYFLSAIWFRIQDFLVYYHGSGFSSIWTGFTQYFFLHIVPIYKLIAFIVSALCVWGIVYVVAKLFRLNKEDAEVYGASKAPKNDEVPLVKNDKWERIVTHVNSTNASDWRLAIIEADIMLDELLKVQGYHGDSLGERLRAVEKSDFTTLDNAWEAHRMRNQIAHQGSDFPLAEREAKRAIMLYESVFREFKMI